MVGIHQSMTKCESGQKGHIMSLSTKLKLNLLSSLSVDVWEPLDQPKARKPWEFSKWVSNIGYITVHGGNSVEHDQKCNNEFIKQIST